MGMRLNLRCHCMTSWMFMIVNACGSIDLDAGNDLLGLAIGPQSI